MSTTPGSSSTKSHFDAAKKIVEELNGMTKEHQTLAIKFAVETLGLQSQAAVVSPTASSPSVAPLSVATPSGGAAPSTDIKTFTDMKVPKSDQQFTAVAAYFYQFEAPLDQRKDVIDAETMKNAARLAGRKQPPKWKYTLINAKNAGYLDPAGNGNYKLSSVGENLVAINLPENVASASHAAARGKKKIKAKSKKVK
jgi:hypothetical protein